MLHVYWPVTAFLTLVVIVGVIIVMLRYGPKLCGLRHTALPYDHEWDHEAYDHQVSYA